MKWRVNRYLVFNLFCCAFALYRASVGDWTLVEAFALCVLFLYGRHMVLFPSRLKKSTEILLAPKHRSVHLAECEFLDVTELGRITREWEVLGFVQRGDFVSEIGKTIAFFRLLENESAGAVVELRQEQRPAKVLPLVSFVSSMWGEPDVRLAVETMAKEMEQARPIVAPLASPTGVNSHLRQAAVHELPIWTLVTHNHVPHPLTIAYRQRRMLIARLPPGTTPARLWQAHFERRILVESRLHKPLFRNNLVPLLNAVERVAEALIAQNIKTTPFYKLLPYFFARPSSVPTNYDGELAPL